MVSQVLVRGVDGRTLCLQVAGSSVRGAVLKELLQERSGGVPAPLQRLVAAGGREVADSTVLYAGADGQLPSCSLVLRLRGGKGGFGSLLRGAAKSGTVTDNFDACRDLSGRRLRHVEREKKMEEWMLSAKERELEQKAMEHIKKVEAEERKRLKGQVDELALKQTTAETARNVADAVESGLKAAQMILTDRKRKKAEEVVVEKKKRSCMWALEDEDLSDSSDGDEGAWQEGGAGGAGPSGTAVGGAAAAAEEEEEEEEDEEDVVDLSRYATAADLEAVGLDGLKKVLQNVGMKCGGSLADRAARLFLLKDTPIEQIDPKHLAKG